MFYAMQDMDSCVKYTLPGPLCAPGSGEKGESEGRFKAFERKLLVAGNGGRYMVVYIDRKSVV